MLRLKSTLEAAIKPILLDAFPEASDFYLEVPKQADHGDYASSIALRLAKVYKKAPAKIAEEMAIALEEKLAGTVSVTPINGFINFKITDKKLWNFRSEPIKAEAGFPEQSGKVLLEYVSANPTGPLHIGHGRWAVIGDVLHRLMVYVGINVDREFYINDAGNQVNLLYASVNALKETKPVPEDGYQGHYIQELADKGGDPKDLILAQQKQVLSDLGVEFEEWFSEKSLHKSGAVERGLAALKERSATYEEEGALWFKSTEHGDDKDRVLIKSDGAYTYFAVDIAYHYDKLQRGYTQLINIWGADHHGYIPRVRAAVEVLTDSSSITDAQFKVILGQLVSLYRDGEQVRMSKRTGDMITLQEVIDEIGVDATRFFLVEKSADTHLDFDLDLAKKTSNENPVYYVQYAHARLCSIQRKLGEVSEGSVGDMDLTLEPAERDLLIHILRLNDVIYEAAHVHAPYQLIQYAIRLARLFHSFYEKCPILKAEASVQKKRLQLLGLCQQTLQLVLGLCGVSSPESM